MKWTTSLNFSWTAWMTMLNWRWWGIVSILSSLRINTHCCWGSSHMNKTLVNKSVWIVFLFSLTNENTKFFSFIQSTNNHTSIKYILEIIPRYCPNIENVDLSSLWIKPENKENLKFFPRETTCLKSLRVECVYEECAIHQLLIQEDFDQHVPDVQSGLLKIVCLSVEMN